MDAKESAVFLTDKYGKKDRTKEILSISFDSAAKVWNVQFAKAPETIYTYKAGNVQIVKNCLADKKASAVFDYLMQMAQFSGIKNESGQSLLVKKLEKIQFVNEASVLAAYLNPKAGALKTRNVPPSLIFPFGCNNSQLKAVQAAVGNQISIIQGPPGTGKTQTILNIIANLLIDGKTVLVVSNNNDATANVYEKLASESYGLGFVCAFHGKKDNIDSFLENQKSQYPEYIRQWFERAPVFQPLLEEGIQKLKAYFAAQERQAEIKSELSAIKTEAAYFTKSVRQKPYSDKKLLQSASFELMALLQKLQFIYTEKEAFGFFRKLNLKLNCGLGPAAFWKTEPELVLETIKAAYYTMKIKELENELNEALRLSATFNPDTVYENCLHILQRKIAGRYLKNKERRRFESGTDIWLHPDEFAREYPVVLSTTFSSRAALGKEDHFLFDYVIVDEASQVDVVTGALALSCAQNAVIVGDKMQLPNVIEENQKPSIRELFKKAHISEGYSFMHSFLESLELILPATPQTLLREHYRCHPKIIGFCNQQFYGGQLLILTDDKGEKDVLSAIRTAPGDFCRERCNQRQIDILTEEVLPKFSREEIQSLGIIAPYNNQAAAIQARISGADAATVHKYQGREKDCIVISTVDNEITSFADNPNMLNVAVSRAKKKLVVIVSGNRQPERSNLAALMKYIQYHSFTVEESKIHSIFDFLYTRAGKAKFDYLKSIKKISQFDSENAMNGLLTELFSAPEYARFGFVFEMPLKELVVRAYMQELPPELAEYASRSWAHVDFIVFNAVTKEICFGIEVDGYTYHKKGTRQADRDAKKDLIFRLIGIPLLRFSTRGSGEREQIKKTLEQFL